MVRSVRKVPKYGIVPCIAPCGERQLYDIFKTTLGLNKHFKDATIKPETDSFTQWFIDARVGFGKYNTGSMQVQHIVH